MPLTPPRRPLMPPIPLLAAVYLHSLPAPNAPLTAQVSLDCSSFPLTPPILPRSLQCPLMPPIPLLAPEHLHSLPAPQCTPNSPQSHWWPLTPYTLGAPLCHIYPCWPLSTLHSMSAPNASLTPPTLPDSPQSPW